jgi:hypothetical protein
MATAVPPAFLGGLTAADMALAREGFTAVFYDGRRRKRQTEGGQETLRRKGMSDTRRARGPLEFLAKQAPRGQEKQVRAGALSLKAEDFTALPFGRSLVGLGLLTSAA